MYRPIKPRVQDLTRQALIDHYEKRILILESEIQGLRNIIHDMQDDIKKYIHE